MITRAFAILSFALLLGCQASEPDDLIRKSALLAQGPGPCWQIEATQLLLKPRCDGPARVAFPVRKHFDIRRSYNPMAGEEVNVIVESEERPLAQREYLRVAFAQPSALGPSRHWPFGLLGLGLIALAIAWSRRRV